jgi:hypothetical protein
LFGEELRAEKSRIDDGGVDAKRRDFGLISSGSVVASVDT